jgi:hypothetical protein
MDEKIELKEKLAAVDLGAKEFWRELSPSQQKTLKGEMFILNRYVSNVKGQSREIQEHFVLTVNEFFNKHWFVLQKHPQLLWQLLCMCNYDTKKIFWHEWIGYKRKDGKKANSKVLNFLLEIYPARKKDELEMLAALTSVAEVKKLAQAHGYDDKQIEKFLK